MHYFESPTGCCICIMIYLTMEPFTCKTDSYRKVKFHSLKLKAADKTGIFKKKRVKKGLNVCMQLSNSSYWNLGWTAKTFQHSYRYFRISKPHSKIFHMIVSCYVCWFWSLSVQCSISLPSLWSHCCHILKLPENQLWWYAGAICINADIVQGQIIRCFSTGEKR